MPKAAKIVRSARNDTAIGVSLFIENVAQLVFGPDPKFFPSLAPHIVDDISEMAIGHLGKGLLKAHGWDEGGLPGVGAHDAMWFAARDLAFGAGAHPDVDPPENIARPEAGSRFMPELPPQIEGLLSLLMNLLVIEFRAEIGFASTQAVMRTEGLFDAAAANEAAK